MSQLHWLSIALLGQGPLVPMPEAAPAVRDAGTYHVATGTWTRARRSANAPVSSSLYCNLFPGGLYFPAPSESTELIDFGRVPSRSSPAPDAGSSDAYIVDCFTFNYCTSSPVVDVTWRFYDAFSAGQCPGAAGDLVARIEAPAALPGSSAPGVLSCWLVTLDLSGTTLEFPLFGDGDGDFDGSLDEDSFGFSVQFNDLSDGPAGVVLGGDCGAGAFCGGLGTDDYFFLDDGLSSSCTNVGGCPAATEASFSLQLSGRDAGNLGTNFCLGAPNSTGRGARMLAAGSDRVVDNELTLRAARCPASTAGLFYFGPGQAQAPFGDGLRCVSGSTARIQPPVVTSPEGLATRALDLTSGPAAARIVPGSTWNFQFWYRDGAAMGSGFNTSDGLQVAFQ